jgi:hypothetical protein
MARSQFFPFYCLIILVAVYPPLARAQAAQADGAVLAILSSHQYNLDNEGHEFLLAEAKENDFFLLGELHGENEIPELLRALWPEMWKVGYRHIAAEVSPWAAHQLEDVPAGQGPEVVALWSRSQAKDIGAFASPGADVLWGCDMEEVQPQFLIRELAGLNPGDPKLERMVQITKHGYDRKMAPELLALATGSDGKKDETVNEIPLRQNLLGTLEIETNRAGEDTKMIAQNERELLMKEQFLAHLNHASVLGTPSKVLLRFGRNHLHRGYDGRGISTLGNFIAEYAIEHRQKAFNVGAFAAGGKETLMGETFDADERQDELTFALLAEKAKYSATVFDLRPLRQLLHRIPEEKRSSLEVNLIYWSDAYDSLLCYKRVTPLSPTK